VVAFRGLQSVPELAGYWIFGLCFWTIIEYVLHRGLFHLDE
jgi:4-hydroxysphinganine ceramide fatty acyl 2-hydroxylase